MENLHWYEMPEPEPLPPDMQGMRIPKECKTAKCQRCGRFTSKLHPVFASGWPTTEVLYEAGDCCADKLNL
jgi:hypothetical protein